MKKFAIAILFALSACSRHSEKHDVARPSPVNTAVSPLVSAQPVIPPHVAESSVLGSDGIRELFPTVSGGRTYRPSWNNGKERSLRWHERDPFDPQLSQLANGILDIDGKGILTAHGDPLGSDTKVGESIRIFQFDPHKKDKWLNIEATAYMMRVRETKAMSYQGFTIGARSEHQETEVDKHALGHTYYARLEYGSGKVYFVKEVGHHLPDGYVGSDARPLFKKGFPTNSWVGMKFIIRNIDNGSAVKLEAWVDLTDGKDGGKWEKVDELVDRGDWLHKDGKKTGAPFLAPATAVFFRNDELVNGGEAKYKNWSIREVAPL